MAKKMVEEASEARVTMGLDKNKQILLKPGKNKMKK